MLVPHEPCSYDTGEKGKTRLYSNGHQQKKAGSCSYDTGKKKRGKHACTVTDINKKKPKEITQKAWMGSAPGQRHGKKITGKI